MKKIETKINSDVIFKVKRLKGHKFTAKDEFGVIRIYPEIEKQSWLGLGGALTESSCYNYQKLPSDKRKEFLKAYYGKKGLSYDFTRIAIGSCDFSLDSHSYEFKRDINTIIPTLKEIISIRPQKIIASPWSPPKEMKNNKKFNKGKLDKKKYDSYAEYLKNFIYDYKCAGIDINYLTMQNEPYANQSWESCTYTALEQKRFIYDHLIEKIKDTKTQILVHDHNKENLVDVMNYLYEDNEHIAGLAYHSYTGFHHDNISLVRNRYSKALLIQTESCCGYSPYDKNEWVNDAEYYMKQIIGDANAGANAFIDWNLLLDYNGGPNHKGNFCKSPIILNEREDDFILTPIYYYLLHIGKYIKKDYKIIANSKYRNDILVLSAKGKKIVVVVVNPTDEDIEYNIVLGKYAYCDKLSSHSIATYVE